MKFFFEPRGIAVIGATPKPDKGGQAILQNLLSGFKGPVYPVNPGYQEIEGLTCYPSVLQVPDPVDLAIVFVPAALVPPVIRECAQRGLSGAMIESAGFSETGAAGRALQEELKKIVRQTGIRLWGPNCMGLVDAVRRHVFSFVSPKIWDDGIAPGRVSLIVQSGMLSGAFLIDALSHGTTGVSKVCSIGNKVDVDEGDLLEYLIADPDSGAIGLYLESIPRGRRFLEICRRSPKPLVVLKGGKSPKGAQAAMSHTASLAGRGALVSGVLAQAGVVEANDFKQMLDLCRSLARFPRPPARSQGRVAILTYSGGAGIVSADFMDQLGLEVAELSEPTRQALEKVFPEWMPVANPVDLWPAMEVLGPEKACRRALRAVWADPDVDAVLLHAFAGASNLHFNIASLIHEAHDPDKPLFCWLLGEREEARRFQLEAQDLGVPVFRELYRSVECLAAVLNQRPRTGQVSSREGQPETDLLAREQDLLASGRGALDEHVSKQILAQRGIPVVEEKIAASAEEAGRMARDLGFPVVLKGLEPGRVHKTELGLVKLSLASAREVGEAYQTLKEAMSEAGQVLVQRQVRGELELILGLFRDPQFGTCVMAGLGGVLAEVFNEAVFAAAPLNLQEALDLLGRLGAQKLLNGYRGTLPLNREAVARILIALGDLGLAQPKIKEIDLNPVIISRGQPLAVDATIVISD